jgi:predicted amidophosphoribosyltransferase
MRERHIPRVCGSCRAPMARQERTCWQCGTRWASEDEPRPKLTLIAGGAQPEEQPDRAIAVAARADARLDAERWANEGAASSPMRSRA